jgi:hypothetical protein
MLTKYYRDAFNISNSSFDQAREALSKGTVLSFIGPLVQEISVFGPLSISNHE